MIENRYSKYEEPSIYTIPHLCSVLSCNKFELEKILAGSESFYKVNTPKQKNGKKRITYTVLSPLKEIQNKIKRNILDKVMYPSYLFGGIKKRNVQQNARLHANSSIIINEDITSYFDNCSESLIYLIWRSFFKFSKKVSLVLTRLTTYKGFIPQGACTSPHLANLFFWKEEPKLASFFAENGHTYSRVIDDMTVSSKNPLANKDKCQIIESIYGMMKQKGLKPKRKKHSISSKKDAMVVNNQRIRNGKVFPNRLLKERLKMLVRLCSYAKNDENDLSKKIKQAMGLYNYIRLFYIENKLALPTKVIKSKQILDDLKMSVL